MFQFNHLPLLVYSVSVVRSHLLLLCPALVLGGIFAVTPPVRAQDKSQEIKLQITKPIEGKLALYHTIKITVDNLSEWVKKPDNDYTKFVLYIDANRFEGLQPTLVDNNAKLQFDIKRVPNNEKNKEAWTSVLSRRPKSWSRPVYVTVGVLSCQINQVRGHLAGSVLVRCAE